MGLAKRFMMPTTRDASVFHRDRPNQRIGMHLALAQLCQPQGFVHPTNVF